MQEPASPLRELSGKRKAKMLYNKGLKALDKLILPQAPFLKYDDAVQYFHQSALVYLSCSKWREAAESLLECARIHRKFLKEERESAIFLTEAANILLRVDKRDAIKQFKAAIKIYCDIGDFSKAGNLQFEVAELQYELKSTEEAAVAYRRAADFYSPNPDRSDYCLFQAAECYGQVKQFKIAADLYLLVAEGCTQSNLRKFNSRPMLLNHMLCNMAIMDEVSEDPESEPFITRLDELVTLSKKLEDIDFSWRGSREQKFFSNIVSTIKSFSMHDFADHIYHWNLVKPFTSFQISVMKTFHDYIKFVLDKREKVRQLAQKEQERRLRRAERRRKKREMREEADADTNSDEGSDAGSEGSSDIQSSDHDGSADNKSDSDSSKEDEVENLINDLDKEPGDEDEKVELPDELKDSHKATRTFEKKW